MKPKCRVCEHAAAEVAGGAVIYCSVRGEHCSANYSCSAHTPRTGRIGAPADTGPGADSEADLLAACLKALRDRAYYAATPDNHVAAATGKIRVSGFYVHLNGDVRHQPQLPDILILPWTWRDNVVGCDRPPLLVELKVCGPRGGKPKYQPGQKELIDCGYWCECRTIDGFTAALAAWELDA